MHRHNIAVVWKNLTDVINDHHDHNPARTSKASVAWPFTPPEGLITQSSCIDEVLLLVRPGNI